MLFSLHLLCPLWSPDNKKDSTSSTTSLSARPSTMLSSVREELPCLGHVDIHSHSLLLESRIGAQSSVCGPTFHILYTKQSLHPHLCHKPLRGILLRWQLTRIPFLIPESSFCWGSLSDPCFPWHTSTFWTAPTPHKCIGKSRPKRQTLQLGDSNYYWI